MKSAAVSSALSIYLFLVLVNGCRKDTFVNDPPLSARPPIISNSFTEDFDVFASLNERGWVFKNNSTNKNIRGWGDGYFDSKSGPSGPPISPAYSFRTYEHEFAYAGRLAGPQQYINMWMFTPPIEIKNDDVISFFTRADTSSTSVNRLQVRLNTVDTSSNVGGNAEDVGRFTLLLADVNASMSPSGYPRTWSKVEHVISGVAGTIKSRVAFRYYVPATTAEGGVGVDLFTFKKQ